MLGLSHPSSRIFSQKLRTHPPLSLPLLPLSPPPLRALAVCPSSAPFARLPDMAFWHLSLPHAYHICVSSSAPTGMANARSSLPHQSTREIYSPATPSYNRRPEPRSPSFATSTRRHAHSPTPTPNVGFTHPLRMPDSNHSNNRAPTQTIPPLNPVTNLGILSYADTPGTQIQVDISGVIDKGFFLADNEWTCYRRNYFSCICSYTLSPAANFGTQSTQFLPKGATQPYTVYAFAMSISAVVADNDNHAIELVQHTPKRDKGPIAKPDKVRLLPKPAQALHHPLGNLYSQDQTSRTYEQGYGPGQGSHPTEHAFERIQFKQATANNGKRRAAQQFYHLVVELWADVGTQHTDQYVKVAYRKSAKMIVRGRSPGHYQSERRGSTSSGPGGSGGGSIGGGYTSSVMGHDYQPGGSLLQTSAYSNPSYDARSSSYGGTRHHHELTLEPIISQEETKGISDPKGYQYYPTPLYESTDHDAKHQVEMFAPNRGDHETLPHIHSGVDMTNSRVKAEPDTTVPSMYYAGQTYWTQRCGRFEGKSGSSGYSPTMFQPASTLNIPT